MSCSTWWKQPNIELLSPSHATYKVFEELGRTTQVESALTTDVLIAAFAIERKAQLASNDTDFLRFAGVRLVNPLQTKGRWAPRSSGR